jgi:hypothetical protein
MKRPMRYPMKRPIANMAINKQTIKNTSTVILNTVIINVKLCNIFVKYLQSTNQKLVGITLQADSLKVWSMQGIPTCLVAISFFETWLAVWVSVYWLAAWRLSVDGLREVLSDDLLHEVLPLSYSCLNCCHLSCSYLGC